jgi:hypothetical protein
MGRQIYKPDTGPYTTDPEPKLGKPGTPTPKPLVKPATPAPPAKKPPPK